jgi:hypothetical protein
MWYRSLTRRLGERVGAFGDDDGRRIINGGERREGAVMAGEVAGEDYRRLSTGVLGYSGTPFDVSTANNCASNNLV